MKNIILVLICLIFMRSTCKIEKFNGYDNRLHIVNNANYNVYFAPFYSYPDTTLFGPGEVPTTSPITYKVNAQSAKKLSTNCCWEDIIKELGSDTLMIFIFDAQVLETTPWDTVQANYLMLKRYDLSVQDLEDNNWTVTYP